jgi:AcrR family transcriptional regulator
MTRVKVVRGVSKAEWLPTVLKVMGEEGVDKIAVEGLARSLGITKAGFYWHFRIRRELYDALLEVWERVMTAGLARLDLALWHWAQSDAAARKVFNSAPA